MITRAFDDVVVRLLADTKPFDRYTETSKRTFVRAMLEMQRSKLETERVILASSKRSNQASLKRISTLEKEAKRINDLRDAAKKRGLDPIEIVRDIRKFKEAQRAGESGARVVLGRLAKGAKIGGIQGTALSTGGGLALELFDLISSLATPEAEIESFENRLGALDQALQRSAESSKAAAQPLDQLNQKYGRFGKRISPVNDTLRQLDVDLP